LNGDVDGFFALKINSENGTHKGKNGTERNFLCTLDKRETENDFQRDLLLELQKEIYFAEFFRHAFTTLLIAIVCFTV